MSANFLFQNMFLQERFLYNHSIFFQTYFTNVLSLFTEILNLAKRRQFFFSALGLETEEQTNLAKTKIDMVTIKQHQNP